LIEQDFAFDDDPSLTQHIGTTAGSDTRIWCRKNHSCDTRVN
jgi:hypothetical protein